MAMIKTTVPNLRGKIVTESGSYKNGRCLPGIDAVRESIVEQKAKVTFQATLQTNDPRVVRRGGVVLVLYDGRVVGTHRRIQLSQETASGDVSASRTGRCTACTRNVSSGVEFIARPQVGAFISDIGRS